MTQAGRENRWKDPQLQQKRNTQVFVISEAITGKQDFNLCLPKGKNAKGTDEDELEMEEFFPTVPGLDKAKKPW